MASYMLDTDTISFYLRGKGNVPSRVHALSPSAICMSSITLAELYYGSKLNRSRRASKDIHSIARIVPVKQFDAAAAEAFGDIAAHLKDAGTPIGDMDALISAHARSLGLTVVTNNTKHFSLVPGLKVENWL